MTPGFIRLWRGTESLDLQKSNNARADTYTTDWTHLAFTIARESGEVGFYVDGDLLDFGTALISTEQLGGESLSISYTNLEWGAPWDAPDDESAAQYYGKNQIATVVSINDACDESVIQDLEIDEKTIVLLKHSGECSDYDQGRNMANAGAWMIMFEELVVLDGGDENTGSEDGGSAAQPDEALQPLLAVPVLSISPADFTAMVANGSASVTRTRTAQRPGTPISTTVESNGVLALGQEPDAPWGDFDEFQSANGVVDEYRVWNTVRSPVQIKENYRRTIQEDDPAYGDLAVYWKFDEAASLNKDSKLITLDSSADGNNSGLLGRLPTVENQLQYVTERGKLPPTSPDRIITTSSPLVGIGQEHVVPVVPGDDTILELKSFDPDGDDLSTSIISIPTVGTLHPIDGDGQAGADRLASGDAVIDQERTESKRIVYRAPANFASEQTFDFAVSDGGEAIQATIRLVPHVMFQPSSKTETINEDKLVAFSLAQPSQYDQRNMVVEITSLPTKGQLYQAQFNPDSYPTWTSLATFLNEYGEMEAITSEGDVLNTDRGIVMFLPDKDEHSSGPDDVYAEFSYRFVDRSGLKSDAATVSIIVNAVNDAPVGLAGEATVDTTSEVVIALESTDVDGEAAESFAERPYSKVVNFPLGGQIFQYKEDAVEGSNRGAYMDAAVTAVPQTFSWASRVVRYSSQFSLCGSDCFTWKNPLCSSSDVLSGGREDGTCSETSWHASNILGGPNFYPGYADAKLGWDLSSENAGNEWIELEYPFAVYVSAFELYETFKPGSLWKISTTEKYGDNTDQHCSGLEIDDVPKCSEDTEWSVLWQKPQESVGSTGDSATIFAPPLCPSTKRTRIIRLDLDTARASGWNNFDAAKVTGSLEAPPGLLDDSSNRLVYVPLDGVHGQDKLYFTASDCLDVGDTTEFVISITAPKEGSFSSSSFLTREVPLADASAGEVVNHSLDLTDIIQEIQKKTKSQNIVLTGTIFHTEALGVGAGEIYDAISLENPAIEMQLGIKTTKPSRVELWLEDSDSGLTFRVNLLVRIFIACDNGSIDDSRGVCVCATLRWGSSDCSVEKVENRNELPTAIKAVGYTMFGILFLLIVTASYFVYHYREYGPVKVSQPIFLFMLLGGCLLCTLTIILLQIEGSDLACALRPWFWSLGFSVIFGSLWAKIMRVYQIFRNGRHMRRKVVSVTEVMRPVIFLLGVNTIILSVWTALDPMKWTRVVTLEDGYGYVLNSYGMCASANDMPYLLSLGIINAIVLIVALVLSYKARNIPSDFQEGKYISLAVFSCIEIYFIGTPVVIIVGSSNPAISSFVQSAVVFLTTLAVLLLIFGPQVYNVFFRDKEEESRSKYSVASSASRYAHGSTHYGAGSTYHPSQVEVMRARLSQASSHEHESDTGCRRLSNDSGVASRRQSNESCTGKRRSSSTTVNSREGRADIEKGEVAQGTKRVSFGPLDKKSASAASAASEAVSSNSVVVEDVTPETAPDSTLSGDGAGTSSSEKGVDSAKDKVAQTTDVAEKEEV